MLALSRDLPVPLYHQVKTSILSRIETGQWRPGDRLPSEDELSGRLQGQQDHGPPGPPRAGPARTHPPRAGARDLRAAAAARRRAASAHQLQRGDAPPGRPGPVRGPRAGDRAGVGRRRLHARHRRGGAGLPPAPPAPRRRQPDGRADRLIPARLVPRIEDIEFSRSSLYDVLGGHYNLVPASAHETHFAFAVGRADAALLRLDEGAPVMGTELVARLADGRALEYVQLRDARRPLQNRPRSGATTRPTSLGATGERARRTTGNTDR